MQNVSLLAMAGLFALQSATGAISQDSKRPAIHLPKHEARLAYAVQTVSVRAGCFPVRLRAILSHIATKTGRRPIVTSGLRPHPSRHGSLHGKCSRPISGCRASRNEQSLLPPGQLQASAASAAIATASFMLMSARNGDGSIVKRERKVCRAKTPPQSLQGGGLGGFTVERPHPSVFTGLRFRLRRIMPRSAPPIRKAAAK